MMIDTNEIDKLFYIRPRWNELLRISARYEEALYGIY